MANIRPTWLSEHLQSHHSNALKMDLTDGFNVHNTPEWGAYHDHLHKHEADHYHPERTEPVERQVWVVHNKDEIACAASTPEDAQSLADAMEYSWEITETTLHPQLVPPIYGGPTLLAALWEEMDAIMERLMTKTESEDGGDKFRAQQLGWVLAIVTNGYRPSVPAIRAEAVRRFKEGA